MLSVRLVRLIEDHAEELIRGLTQELQSNSRTAAYHRLPRADLQHRVYDVYRNLGHWLGHETDEPIEAAFGELGKKRAAEGIPLSEVVYALTLAKYHLRNYIRSAGLVDSAVELYQEQELHRLVGHFFDRAIYYAAEGYEREAAHLHAAHAASAKSQRAA
jgi:hypothetical protein